LVLARSGQSPSGHSPTLAAKKDRERKPAALSVWRSASSADAASIAFELPAVEGQSGSWSNTVAPRTRARLTPSTIFRQLQLVDEHLDDELMWPLAALSRDP
jgi:hypothetical protein